VEFPRFFRYSNSIFHEEAADECDAQERFPMALFSAGGDGKNLRLSGFINNLALKLPREPVSGLLGIKPFATNKKQSGQVLGRFFADNRFESGDDIQTEISRISECPVDAVDPADEPGDGYCTYLCRLQDLPGKHGKPLY
jgi:hypothetical protein